MTVYRSGGPVWLLSVLILLVANLGLTGCALGTPGTRGQAEIDAELLVKAPTSLPPAVSGQLSDLGDNHRICTQRYQQLATRCNALVDEVAPPAARAPRWWEFWKQGWGGRP